MALFLTNLSAHSIQQNTHQQVRKQESLTAFKYIFLFQPAILRVLMLELLDFCLVLLVGELDYFQDKAHVHVWGHLAFQPHLQTAFHR